MDIFEKQQRLEAIQKIVKVRWFNAAVIISLGLILKIQFSGWAPGFEYVKIGLLAVVAFGYNFIYWFFIRRPVEKISDRTLNIIALCQVVVDQFMYALVCYFTGTVESIAFLLFYITILVASSLYKTRGIILSGILAVILHNGTLIIEYYRLIPHITAYPGTVWFGNSEMTRGKVIGFTFYMAVAVAFSVVLSNLIRNREARLRQERDKVKEQSNVLMLQTQELSQTKDYLHEALTKSDAARVEIEKTKTDLEKANLELQAKLRELEKYGQVTTGRELRMIELKDKIKTMEARMKELELQINKKQ